MDEFRKEVIRELEKKLGMGMTYFPKTTQKIMVLQRMASLSIKKIIP